MAWSETLNQNTYNDQSFAGNNYSDEATGLPALIRDFAEHGSNLFFANSNTSNTIGTGVKTFTLLDTKRPFNINMPIVVKSASSPSNLMTGVVTSYTKSTNSLQVTFSYSTGSGTFTDWLMEVYWIDYTSFTTNFAYKGALASDPVSPTAGTMYFNTGTNKMRVYSGSAWFNIEAVAAATTTVQGIVELATDAETQTGTDTTRAITPANLSARTATETRTGIVELATDAETQTGTDTTRAITPANLSARTATETRTGIVELATDAETQTGTDTTRAITPANLSARTATETRTGIAEIATQAEVDARTDSSRIVTPDKLAHGTGVAGSNIASASTLTLPAVGDYFLVTGTTTVSAISARTSGRRIFLRFASSLQLTHNASTFILTTGANITTATDDVAEFVAESSGWRMVSYTRATGVPMNAPGVTLISTASASAVSQVDFTGLDSTYDTYILEFNGTDVGPRFQLRVQSASVWQATNYLMTKSDHTSSSTTTVVTNVTSGTELTLTPVSDTGIGSNILCTISIANPSSTTQYKPISFSSCLVSSAQVWRTTGGAVWTGGTGAITGLRILPSTGTITGLFRLYGVKK